MPRSARKRRCTARRSVIVSCEHGGNRIPARWAPLFAGAERLLASHRGFDTGSAALARELARALDAPLRLNAMSRLLADANRSLGHPRLFSERTRALPERERARILDRCWRPHRRAVESEVRRAIGRGGLALHLSVHSFTPRLAGRARDCDVGLLYDPRRPAERELCARWQTILRELSPGLRVRRNHPYRGSADGLTTHLRRRHADPDYVGIELEVNQRRLRGAGAAALRRTLARSVRHLLLPATPGAALSARAARSRRPRASRAATPRRPRRASP